MPLWITFLCYFFESGRMETEEIIMNVNVIGDALRPFRYIWERLLIIRTNNEPPPVLT